MDFDSSVQSIAWIRDRYREGTLSIRPPYQRKPVWAARQKCYLVESILLNLPVPEIYIQQVTTSEGNSTYSVVDGQQRIRTILQFIGVEDDPDEEQSNKFQLDKIDTSSPWYNADFASLDEGVKRKFYGYKFAIRYLNTDSDAAVRDMFRRLNKFLTPLKPQELRNATYSGPFVELVNRLADSEYWAENGIVTPAEIRRMGDVEFVSDLVIGVLHGPQGGGPSVIDSYYEHYEDYESEFPDQRRAQRLFEDTLGLVRRILPGIRDTRWSNKSDFYTLFVGMAGLLRQSNLRDGGLADLQERLLLFADAIDSAIADSEQYASQSVKTYVGAVQRGANDKKRRADRQSALYEVIAGLFEPRESNVTLVARRRPESSNPRSREE